MISHQGYLNKKRISKVIELLHLKIREAASLNRIIVITRHMKGRAKIKNNSKRSIIIQDFQEWAILKIFKTFQGFKGTKKERNLAPKSIKKWIR